jgi:hypothetical protein
MKPYNILVALLALLLLALALPRGANSNNKVNGGAEGSANLAKPRAHQFEKETREGARLAWIDESYKTSSSKPQESRKIRPVDFLVNLPRLSTMRNSGGAAGRLPAWTANAVGLWPCASEKGNNGLYNYIIIRFAETTHPESVYIPLREAHDDTADRMASIYQKCPTASTEIVLVAFKYGRRYNVEPELLLAIAHEESRFITTRHSRSSFGLMGVNYGVWRKALSLNPYKLWDIDYNMDKGAAILRWWIDACHGDLWLAVHRYNNGYKYKNAKYLPRVREVYGRMK